MNAAGLRRPDRLRTPLGVAAAFAFLLLAHGFGCSPASPTPSRLEVWPETTQALDATADSHDFRFRITLGSRGLAVGDRVEIRLFPAREAPRSSVVMLDGGAITGKLRARAAPRASLRADDPGGTAVLEIEAIAPLDLGQVIEARIESARLPQQGYGLSGPAKLSMPVLILRAGTASADVESFDGAQWTLAPEPAEQLVLRLPSEVAPGGEATLAISLLSKEGYPARDARASLEVELPGGVEWIVPPHAFDEGDAGVQHARLRFSAPGLYRIEARAGDFTATSNPVWVRMPGRTDSGEPAPKVYWGDLHNHTRYSFDSRNRNLTAVGVGEALDFARRASMLDFIAVTDHGPNGIAGPVGAEADFETPTATDMSADDWAAYSAELATAHVPGLIVFAGFEHLGARGHTCLVFRESGDYFIAEGRRLALAALWARAVPGSLISIPHLHPLEGMSEFEAGSEHETLVEMHSKWGSYEFYGNPDPNAARRREDAEERAVHERGEKGPFVRDLLAAGKRYGFVGASDHGPPGQYGLTAVLASGLTREAIFEALLARRTWVTTGTRTLLEFRVGDATLGEVRSLSSGDPLLERREVVLKVNAALPIELVEILRNGEVWRTEPGDGRTDVELSWSDEAPLEGLARARDFSAVRSAEYYARVTLGDAQMAWSSPIFFEVSGGSEPSERGRTAE